MEKHDLTFTIVIIAENNNPTIFNPDFLIRNNIVPADWVLNQNSPILTTPPLSQFEYVNGISFQLDLQRLRIRDLYPQGDIFPVPEIAVKYLELVPHVNYHSLGINFETALIFETMEESKNYQQQRFLKEGPWYLEGKLSEFMAKFVYDLSDCQCNINFSLPVQLSVTNWKNNTPKNVLILSANFHRSYKELKGHEERNEAISKAILRWKKDKEYFKLLTERLVGELNNDNRTKT